MGEVEIFIRNYRGYIEWEGATIILSAKTLYLKLGRTMLALAKIVASVGDCFCSIRYLGCHNLCTRVGS